MITFRALPVVKPNGNRRALVAGAAGAALPALSARVAAGVVGDAVAARDGETIRLDAAGDVGAGEVGAGEVGANEVGAKDRVGVAAARVDAGATELGVARPGMTAGRAVG